MSQSIPMVDLTNQYARIKPAISEAFDEILQSGAFINGPYVKQFTKNLADYLGVKHVIPCGNGTDALQIALMALDTKPGDEVITTPFTFVATAEVIALLGLKPVFVDTLPDTFNLDYSKLEAAITPRTRCIIPVHLFGQSSHMEPIMQIANAHNIAVVEDNAQAIGAHYIFSDGSRERTGNIGDMGTTSFYPTKNLGCYGDGGALCTNSDEYGKKIHMIANHGSAVRYYHDEIGVNSRLDSLQAAVLDTKLKHLDAYNQARQEAADRYDEMLKDVLGLQIPERAPYSTHVFHQYTLTIRDGKRDAVKSHLQSKNIAHSVYYPVPLHMQNAYSHYGYQEGDFPVAERQSKEVLSLPMHTELTAEVQTLICDAVKEAL